MSGILLHPQYEFLLRSGFGVCIGSAVCGKHHAGEGRERIGVAIDHHQRPRRNEREHGRAVEFRIDTRHHTVIKGANELRIERYAVALSCSLDCGLDCSHSRLPSIVVQGPTEALHRNARYGYRDSRIGGCGEVRLHAALRNTNHADAFRIDVIAGLEIIDQPHHIPHGVVKERMFLAGFIGAKDRIIVPALSPLPVIPAVYGYCHKTACRQFAGQIEHAFFAIACSMQHDDCRAPPGRLLWPDHNSRNSFLGIGRKCEMRGRESPRCAGRTQLRIQGDARPVDDFKKPGPDRCRIR